MQLTGRIKFNGVDIGQHGTITCSYEGNVQTVIIPRAVGVKIWSTQDLGGGIVTITISAAYTAPTVISGEEYSSELYATLNTKEPGTLLVTSEGTSLTLNNVYIKSYKISSEKTLFRIELDAIKSA